MAESEQRSSALFLDRDGTLIKDVGFLSDPEGVVLLEGVKEALHRAIRTHRLYLFSNQSGIGRGYYTMEQAHAINVRMEELLALPSPGFSRICMAPERPEEPAVYRKPSPKFIRECIEQDGLDPAGCWMVGDRLSDLQAGVNAGIHAALLHNPDHFKEETRAFAEAHHIPLFDSLPQALEKLSGYSAF
jgi:D-glycero-D-manno-heptose 1,7-bisphosphate phosphatase